MKTEFETVELDIEQLPTKYLALCEIFADLSGVTINEVNAAVDEYIESQEYISTELPNNEGGIH